MPHVMRDKQGRIVAVLDRGQPGQTDEVAPDDPELLLFIAGDSPERAHFLRADLEFIRVLEDLIEVLIDKRVILLTDLPAEAQQKILSRGRLREHLRGSQGLIEDDSDSI
jgi:hypothetical protein